MPTINLGQKRKPIPSRAKGQYQAIYQDKRWVKLRALKFAMNPLCELCETKGRVTQTDEVHHVKPFDINSTQAEIEALAFDWNNLISLCTDCHHAEHKKLHKS